MNLAVVIVPSRRLVCVHLIFVINGCQMLQIKACPTSAEFQATRTMAALCTFMNTHKYAHTYKHDIRIVGHTILHTQCILSTIPVLALDGLIAC